MGIWVEVKDWIINAGITLVWISTEAFLALALAGCAFPLVSIVKDINKVLCGITFSHI